MKSYDTKLTGIKKGINEATSEFPKYQLIVTTEENTTYHITDCWIDKFEFENHRYECTKCYFLCNDVQQLNTFEQKDRPKIKSDR